MKNKNVALSIAERNLIADAMLNYVGYLEMRIALPEEKERRDWFSDKLDRVKILSNKIV